MIGTYIAIYVIDIIALFFLFVLLYHDNFLSRHRKKMFSYGIIFSIIVIFAEFGTLYASKGGSEFRILNFSFNVLGFALTPFIPFVLISIFDSNILKKYKILFLPTILNVIATVLSPFLGYIFVVDVNNNYARGNFFLLFVIVYIINIVLLVIVTWYHGRKRFYLIKWKITGLSLFTIAGTCVQLFVPTVYLSWHCVTLTLFLLYILISAFEASFDTLTKLQNRSAYEKVIKQYSGNRKFSVIVMDINNFKEANDTYGHEYGDMVLKEISLIIRNVFDNNCSSFRIGGDEFCIIRRDANKKGTCQSTQAYCKRDCEKREETWFPTIAYGYGISYGDKIVDFQKIMKIADDQLYKQKQGQKDSNIQKDDQ